MRTILKIMLCVFVSCSIATSVKAQHKIRYNAVLEQSMLINKNNTSTALQLINGIAYKNWFAGVGISADLYRYTTVPLFLHIRKELGKQTHKPFLYLDGGLNIYASTKDADYKNGGYFAGGVGYALHFKKRQAVLFSVGYSYKGFKKYETYPWDKAETFEYQNNFNRLALKVGWQF